MAHNIHTLPEEGKMAKTLDDPSEYYEDEHYGGDDSKILTVGDDDGRQIRLLFSRISNAVVVNPWGDYVRIGGEDLYALRELLNELPEKAFVRPSDPVDSDLKALLDAPVRAVAVDREGDTWRKVAHSNHPRSGGWVLDKEGNTYITYGAVTPHAYGAKIVWTPEVSE